MIHISVVVPTHNRADSLRHVLYFLSHQTVAPQSFEVIVVDDGSSDHTADVVARSGLANSRYQRQDHRGEIAARNFGASVAQGQLLAFIDDDIYISRRYLEALWSAHSVGGRRIVVGAVQHYFDPGVDPRALILRVDSESDKEMLVEEVPFVQCSGHSFSIAKVGYEEVGGMQPLDASGRNAWGGIDFSYRAHRMGYTVYRAYTASCLHHDYGLRDLPTTLLRWERTCAQAVLLLQRHPGLRGRIPLLRNKEEISWRHDSAHLIANKLLRRVLAIGHLMRLADCLIQIVPQWLRPLVLQLAVCNHMTYGYHHGVRLYGSVCKR